MDYGYLQHGDGFGPFSTEKVSIRHLYADNYEVWFQGHWRKLHIQVKRLYIVYMGARITVLFDGA